MIIMCWLFFSSEQEDGKPIASMFPSNLRKRRGKICTSKDSCYICSCIAAVAQLAEHWLPKPRVAGSNPVCRSCIPYKNKCTPKSPFQVMAYVFISLIIIGLLLMATENINRINKAAVAMFIGVMCWILYIIGAPSFILSEHPLEFFSYISSHSISSTTIKEFIASQVFVKYVAQSAEIVLFLMSTATIAEVLNNNGCFDFIQYALKTQTPQRFLWLTTLLAFAVSANIDNLTCIILLLSITHPLLRDSKAKRILASNMVIAACCGGAVTTIGDVTTLTLWNAGLITPTHFFLTLAIPVLVFQAVVTTLLSRCLPERLPYNESMPAYRGDDNMFSRWQRSFMLFIGIGGLWFIPTFHRITLLPPFLGALCVLAFLWFINELFNHSLLNSQKMVRKRLPIAFQYATMQNLLFFIGLSLIFGAWTETGIPRAIFKFLCSHDVSIYGISSVVTIFTALFGNLASLLAGMSIFHTQSSTMLTLPPFVCDGDFWPLLIYCTTMGGMVLSTSSLAGIILTRSEDISFGWYFRHITPKVVVGAVVGFICLCGIQLFA